jgi:hypothetical protein
VEARTIRSSSIYVIKNKIAHSANYLQGIVVGMLSVNMRRFPYF